MHIIRSQEVDPLLIHELRLYSQRFTYNGHPGPANRRIIQSSRRLCNRTGTCLVFTRDIGYHSSGWWKNPDYERCYHLSLSYFDPQTMDPAPHNFPLSEKWVKAFYGNYAKWVWSEPPMNIDGRDPYEVLMSLTPNRPITWHFRLFCDEGWQPIKPRGEVYGRDLTEAGWRSFSNLQDHLEKLRIESEQQGM